MGHRLQYGRVVTLDDFVFFYYTSPVEQEEMKWKLSQLSNSWLMNELVSVSNTWTAKPNVIL